MAAFYSIYHGPKGLKLIAEAVHAKAVILAEGVKGLACEMPNEVYFDTVRFNVKDANAVAAGTQSPLFVLFYSLLFNSGGSQGNQYSHYVAHGGNCISG